jgi:hypothetical protein
MAKQYSALSEPLLAFIAAQNVFFVGMGVPYLTAAGERTLLADWATKKSDAGLRQYWEDKNQLSIDNIPTHIIEKNSQP